MLIPTLAVPTPSLLSKEQALALLQPYLKILNQCIDDGWSAWKTHYSHRSHILDGRPRAAIVYAEIVNRALEVFQGLEGVKIVRHPGSLMIYIGDDITIRFKKIRKDGRCSNIKTVTQIRFLAQLQLPGMVDGTLVHAGYQLDDLQQNVVRKAIVCQLYEKVLWDIELTGVRAEMVTMPPVDSVGQPSAEPRFVAKGARTELPADAVKKRG
jgi:hypothetical protein